jgi:uncharacterized protein YneF (UPF0154 family)
MEDIGLFGWILLVTGIIVKYFIARRRFSRRGPGGLQHFSSFEKGLLITIIEYVFSLLSFLLILGGILFLGFYYSSKWFDNRRDENVKPEKETTKSESNEKILPLPPSSELVFQSDLKESEGLAFEATKVL